ncbi:MAG: hypothetical protein EHM42_07515 [Planctomycetaceae bacterium]|nr:MAG: hypothetical protein EHM42_07515 [Planctomycetaceae bacterium]
MSFKKFWFCDVLLCLGLPVSQAQESAPSYLEESSAVATDTWGEVPQPGKLFGVIGSTDHCFDDFISPMTNPVYFEDPRTLTEARFIFLNHHIPSALGGQDAQLYAAQLRAALTENLSLVAAKDGYIVSQNPVLDDGFADLALGLKYNLFRDPEAQRLVSAGFSYALPIGSTRALQGRTDGEFHLYLTGGTQIFEEFHWLSATGFRLPSDTPSGNQMWYWSNHIDWQVMGSKWYVFTEANWFHYMSSGDAFPAAVGGLDLFNLGGAGVAGNDIVTGAYGMKYKPVRNIEIGAAYEIPYTSQKDILQNRWTFDLIFRF